ncbi:MAG TPA: TFIIB-type zinc ribbon-containing protein, partial [Candidatus Limnocylindrales bacterium]|nr:TFIIB-type zinc ribbon-containing protein [Candidatus Limnocylindrales bacterium]
MAHDSVAAVFRCKQCGKVLDVPHETLEQAAARLAARGPRPEVKITHRGPLEDRAAILFDTAQERLWNDDKAGAISKLKLALEIQGNFTDAHLWLAKLYDDLVLKREHLGEILAHDPSHHEAMLMMMVLDGRITEAEAKELVNRPNEPDQVWETAAAVTTSTAALLCPNCGGHLTVTDDGQVVCRFCGQVVELESLSALDSAGDVLGAAMLERRTKPVRWLIGSRIVHCSQCGAERTLTREELSTRCTFCGSAQVVLQDALGSFEQPEGLIAFQVSEEQAKAAIRDALAGMGERVRGMMSPDNKVVSAALEGVFMPFWVFDALVEVTVTGWDKGAKMQDRRRLQMGDTGYRHSSFRDGYTGLFVPAVTSPPPDLVGELGEFEMDAMRPYEPALLATHSAALYTVDVDRASLEARSIASQRARARELATSAPMDDMSVSALPLQMSFMLVLAPVWVATLHERDGDIRTALVHG